MERPTAISDRDLIERHVERMIVRPDALEIRLALPTEGSPQVERANVEQPAPMPTSAIMLPWTASTFAAVKGIIHASSAKPAMTPQTRDALLLAIAKAEFGSRSAHPPSRQAARRSKRP